MASGGTLAVLTVFAFSFNPTFDLGSSSSASNVESAEATKTLEDGGFSAGATQPTPIVLHSSGDLTQADGRPVRRRPEGRRRHRAGRSAPEISPTDPSTAIVMTVLTRTRPRTRRWRRSATPSGRTPTTWHRRAPTAYVGGITSVFVDFQAAMNRDYKVVFPVAALIIMLILALLLRRWWPRST